MLNWSPNVSCSLHKPSLVFRRAAGSREWGRSRRGVGGRTGFVGFAACGSDRALCSGASCLLPSFLASWQQLS